LLKVNIFPVDAAKAQITFHREMKANVKIVSSCGLKSFHENVQLEPAEFSITQGFSCNISV